MTSNLFTVGEHYTKGDIYRLLNVPKPRQGGNWNTGYTRYDDTWFIFCNIGTAGTTGHNYDNHFDGDDLVWFAKNESHVGQPSIQSLLADDSNAVAAC